jgi:hypothetical protein
MKQIVRHEIYDSTGLVKVDEIEIDVPDIEDQIESKEEELIKIYNEIKQLKEQKQ